MLTDFSDDAPGLQMFVEAIPDGGLLVARNVSGPMVLLRRVAGRRHHTLAGIRKAHALRTLAASIDISGRSYTAGDLWAFRQTYLARVERSLDEVLMLIEHGVFWKDYLVIEAKLA